MTDGALHQIGKIGILSLTPDLTTWLAAYPRWAQLLRGLPWGSNEMLEMKVCWQLQRIIPGKKLPAKPETDRWANPCEKDFKDSPDGPAWLLTSVEADGGLFAVIFFFKALKWWSSFVQWPLLWGPMWLPKIQPLQLHGCTPPWGAQVIAGFLPDAFCKREASYCPRSPQSYLTVLVWCFNGLPTFALKDTTPIFKNMLEREQSHL